MRPYLSVLVAVMIGLGTAGPSGAAKVITAWFESEASDVPARGMTFPKSPVYQMPYDGWIIEAIPEVDGGPWDLLHHGWAFSLERKDTLCPSLPQAIYATGREHIHVRMPTGYGLPVKKGEKWMMGIEKTLMFHNDHDLPFKSVKFRIGFKFYVQEEGDPPLKTLRPVFLNLGAPPHIFTCETDATYWVNPGEQVHRWGREIEVAIPMRVVFLGAHLHNYADYIRLYANGELLWEASPLTDAEGKVLNTPIYLDPKGIELKPGDRLMLETKHTNPLDNPADAMGIVGMGVVMDGEGIPLILPGPGEVPKVEKPHDHHHGHHH